jgi:hypothetical protein
MNISRQKRDTSGQMACVFMTITLSHVFQYLKDAFVTRHHMAILACNYASIVYRQDPPYWWNWKYDRDGNPIDPTPRPPSVDVVEEEMTPLKKHKNAKP